MKKSSGVSEPTIGSVTETSRTCSRLRIARVVEDSRRIAKQPIELMNNNELKGALFADRVGKQFFESLALLEIAKRRLAFLEIFLGYRIAVLFRPLAAGPELGLDGISLDLLLAGDARVNDRCLLLFCVRAHADFTWIDFSDSRVRADFSTCYLRD